MAGSPLVQGDHSVKRRKALTSASTVRRSGDCGFAANLDLARQDVSSGKHNQDQADDDQSRSNNAQEGTTFAKPTAAQHR